MTTYKDVHNDDYYIPEDPSCLEEFEEDRLTREDQRRESRIDDEMGESDE